jgi:hypothetical protein
MNRSPLDRLCVACNYRLRRRRCERYCSGCRLEMIARLHTAGYLEKDQSIGVEHDEAPSAPRPRRPPEDE